MCSNSGLIWERKPSAYRFDMILPVFSLLYCVALLVWNGPASFMRRISRRGPLGTCCSLGWNLKSHSFWGLQDFEKEHLLLLHLQQLSEFLAFGKLGADHV